MLPFRQFRQRTIQRAKALAIKWALGGVTTHGALISPDDRSSAINDGVDYSQPVMLPQHLDEALKRAGGTVRADYLREAMRDTFRFQFDAPYRGASDMPIEPVNEDPLREWNYSTRRMVLSNCHAAYQRNPLANTAVQYTADFVIGPGFNLTTRNTKIEKFLKKFIESKDNAIREYERQAVIDLQVDGELFLRFFQQNGDVVVVPLRPWECQYIKTELGFFRRIEEYQFQIYKTEGDAYVATQETRIEKIPGDEILHVAINRHGYELRGRPELYRVLPWLRADKEFLENRARQNHWRNALLWLVKVANATPAMMAGVVARWSKPPTPGSVAVETDNVNLQSVSPGVGASDAMEDGRQIKLRNIMGLRLPEYMFGDGYNVNLASATAQQLPAMTKFSGFQTIMLEQVWMPLFRRVLTVAVDEGLLPEFIEEQDAEGDIIYLDPDEIENYDDDECPMGKPDAQGRRAKMCKTADAFEVSYAPVGDDGDLLQTTQAMALQMANGLIDKMSAQEKLDLDPAIIAKRLKREEEEKEAEMPQKPPLPGQPPMMPPGTQQQQPGAMNGANGNEDDPNAVRDVPGVVDPNAPPETAPKPERVKTVPYPTK